MHPSCDSGAPPALPTCLLQEWRIEDLNARSADLQGEASRAVSEAEASAARAAALSARLEERSAELEAATLRVGDLSDQAS